MIPKRFPILLPAVLALSSAVESAGDPGVLSAYYDAAEVCFDAPLPVDWKDVGEHYFTQFALSQPDQLDNRDEGHPLHGHRQKCEEHQHQLQHRNRLNQIHDELT